MRDNRSLEPVKAARYGGKRSVHAAFHARKYGVLLLPVLLLLLAGCRIRIVGDPLLADEVLLSQTAAPAEREETPPPPEEPPPEPPEEPEEPEERPVEVPEDQAEESRPDQAEALNEAGPPQFEETAAMGITVTYDPNGGDGQPVRTVVYPGEVYGPQPEARRRGYAFTGWWTAPAGGEPVGAGALVEREDSHTLYAQWEEKITCTLTFDGNGGRVKSREAHVELSQGDAFGPMPTPLREGYRLTGWFTAPEGGERAGEEDLFTGTEDMTLYAQWEYDPLEFWAFVLRSRAQQVYLCQQVPIYFETETAGTTSPDCPLIAGTGSLNIAENREDPSVTDEWVREKRPAVVIKQVSSLDGAEEVRRALAARFPDQEIVLAAGEALGNGPSGVYAGLVLAKHLYKDWYEGVDLDQAARELGVTEPPIQF